MALTSTPAVGLGMASCWPLATTLARSSSSPPQPFNQRYTKLLTFMVIRIHLHSQKKVHFYLRFFCQVAIFLISNLSLFFSVAASHGGGPQLSRHSPGLFARRQSVDLHRRQRYCHLAVGHCLTCGRGWMWQLVRPDLVTLDTANDRNRVSRWSFFSFLFLPIDRSIHNLLEIKTTLIF